MREAYDLNVPMVVADGSLQHFSAFSVDAPNVFIDTVKPAEDGSGDIVLRLYEAKRADTACVLKLGIPATHAWACNMMEDRLEELPIVDGSISLRLHTFEVRTLRLEK